MKKIERKDINKIIELKLKGITIQKIAELCNISTISVKKYTKELSLYKKKREPGRPKKTF